MRLTTAIHWSPNNTEAVYRRFDNFRHGNAPDEVKQAFGRLNIIAWEKLTTNRVLTVVEGDEADLVAWNGYWQDLGDFEIVEPSSDMKDENVLNKITPPGFMRK